MRDAQIHIRPDRVMEHINTLAETIGARPPGSENERRATDYVIEQLRAAGLSDVREQVFKTPRSAGAVFLPFIAAGVVASLIGGMGRLGRVIGGAGLIGLAFAARRALMMESPPFFPLIADGESRTVIARIAPSGSVKRFIFLTAHLDTMKVRRSVPFAPFRAVPPFAKFTITAPLISATFTGAVLIASGVLGVPRKRDGKRPLPFGVNGHPAFSNLFGMMIGMAADEAAPVSPGANGNASGIAALLELAAHLKDHPLENTEVVFVFTGAASAGGAGMTAYLDQYAPPKDFSTFINVQNIGDAESALSFISTAGISYASEYHPAPRVTALVNALAERHPEYGVYSRSAFLLDETGTLRARGYEAITLAGVTRGGQVAGWNSLKDTPDKIAPERITRAVEFIEKILEEMD